MLQKLLSLFLVFFILTSFFVSCSSSNAKPAKKTLIIGLQSGYPPFEYVDNKGEVVGFDIDVAQKLASILGKKLVVKQMGFDALILALKSGKIDLILSGMSITSERLKEIAMIPYHGEHVSTLQLLFWQKVPQEIHSIDDLKGKIVTVQSGTFQEEVLSHYPDIEAKSLENTMELLMDIKYGKSAAALVETHIAKELQYQYSDLATLEVSLKEHEQVRGEGIGITKENPLIAQIEKAVQELKENGQLKLLHQKWFHGGNP